jgi:plasmid stability protein
MIELKHSMGDAGLAASRGADQFVVRLPQGMRDQIRCRAAANRRSINSEILHCLDQVVGYSVENISDGNSDFADDRLDQLIARFEGRYETLCAIINVADQEAAAGGLSLDDHDDAALRIAQEVVDAALLDICRLPVDSLAAVQRKARWLKDFDERSDDLRTRPHLLAAALCSMSGGSGSQTANEDAER